MWNNYPLLNHRPHQVGNAQSKQFRIMSVVALGAILAIFIFPRRQPIGPFPNTKQGQPAESDAASRKATTQSGKGKNEPVDNGFSSEDMEQWRQYQTGKNPYEQLSTANQKRADRHRQIILEQKDQANREQQQAKDIAEGKNTEIRQREAELHQLSEKLYTGMSADQIAILFGEASATWPVSTSFRPKERIPNSDQVLIFSPHPKGKFQHSMGDSFQYLEVWINTNSSKVTGWRWTTTMLRL